MNKNSQQTNLKSSGLVSGSQFLLFTAICIGLSLSACSSSGPSKKSDAQSNAQADRDAAFQKRLRAEQAAEDARDRNAQVQEQTRLEEVELRRLRAERAAQRNSAREAAAQQNPDAQ
jgi:hypothetical protein